MEQLAQGYKARGGGASHRAWLWELRVTTVQHHGRPLEGGPGHNQQCARGGRGVLPVPPHWLVAASLYCPLFQGIPEIYFTETGV